MAGLTMAGLESLRIVYTSLLLANERRQKT